MELQEAERCLEHPFSDWSGNNCSLVNLVMYCVFCAVSACVCKFKALRLSAPCGGEGHPLESRPLGLKFTGHVRDFNTKQEINKEPPSPTCLHKHLMLWNLQSFQRTTLTASTSIDTAVERGSGLGKSGPSSCTMAWPTHFCLGVMSRYGRRRLAKTIW